MVQLRTGIVCITGDYRENNEDCCLVDPEGRYFIVADGMGGQSAGERASELATELVSKRLEQLLDFETDDAKQVLKSIDEAVEHANIEIMALGNVDPNLHNMGTTIVFIVCVAEKFYVGGIGDSRAYRFRDKTLEQLTTDHSLTQALVDAGTISKEDAPTHRYRNVLYRYLGTKDGGSGTEAKRFDPTSGDRFMLCSDGVTDGVDNDEFTALMADCPDPQSAAEAIVAAAQQGGSKDNITCMIVDVE